GYRMDSVAQVDTPELTFQWLTFVMQGGKKPELLRDRINYQQMGSNEWKHVRTLDRMHTEGLTLYFTNERDGEYYRLSTKKPSREAFLEETVDFSDRTNSNNVYSYPSPIIRAKPSLGS